MYDSELNFMSFMSIETGLPLYKIISIYALMSSIKSRIKDIDEEFDDFLSRTNECVPYSEEWYNNLNMLKHISDIRSHLIYEYDMVNNARYDLWDRINPNMAIYSEMNTLS